jgi:hypothetical protein
MSGDGGCLRRRKREAPDIATVSRIIGIAASTIGRGLRELATNIAPEAGRLRRPGGGRKPLVATDPGLLLALVEPTQRGDPMSALRWTCKSLRRLAAELTAQGHPVSRPVVGELLAQQNFSLQANSKPREGGDHPDRDAQFLHIEQSVAEALAAKQPVISVDTKKKELVGDFKNAGRAWRPKGFGCMTFSSKSWAGGALWHLRSGRQCRLGPCRNGPRHG